MQPTTKKAYSLAGVDISLADKVKKVIAQQARTTFRSEVIGSEFFGSMFQLQGYREPVLVSSTDGVGTKVKIASLTGKNDTVGMDIVNHCVNDILCCGAEPLFFLDYIAMGKLVPEQIQAIISGIVQACREVDCSLIGGETAEMPGIYPEGNYDLVGFIVGVVEKKNIISGSSIVTDDVILGLPSSGLHTNGYSLVRKVFSIDANPSCLNKFYPELGRSLGEELLQVHRCYYPQLKPALPLLKGLAHITGGGFVGNIPRILPEGVAARIKKHSWDILPIFKLIQKKGKITEAEMYQVFNMGIGMTIVCSTRNVAKIVSILPQAKVIGEIIKREGKERVIITELATEKGVRQEKTLIIKIGKFTGKLGLEVYERFKQEVDGEWNKLQQTQIRKSSAVRSRKALEEKIIMKALDKFLMPLSTKERLEMETGQSISDNILRMLIHMDEDYTLKELETMCRERDLSPTGQKKLLAWRLLRHEVEKAKKQSG